MSAFPEKSVMKVCGSTLLALRGGGGVQILEKKALRKNVPPVGGRRIRVSGGNSDLEAIVTTNS